MLKRNLILLLLISATAVTAQTIKESLNGVVSYISSQNVYVKFTSTAGINVGDTLFMIKDNQQVAVLQIKQLSSISCVCTPLSQIKLNVNDNLLARSKPKSRLEAKPKAEPIILEPKQTPVKIKQDSQVVAKSKNTLLKQMIYGRLSLASFSSTSNTIIPDHQRMRYTLSLNANNLSNSKISVETYVSFIQRDKQRDTIKSNIFKGLKIYSLNIQYDINPGTKVSLGRKINPRISNVGAIDGLQFETTLKSFVTGIVTGLRPDLYDYSFNGKLLQYGAYLGHDVTVKKLNFQSTIAIMEQKNNGQTDRRFAYLQHNSSFNNKLSFFGSAEFDLYKKIQEVTSTSPRLSNLYLSMRYRVFYPLTLTISYSERQDIIYYETYKSLVERLLASETQKGYSAQLYFQPLKRLSLGGSVSYRDQKGDLKPSKNAYTYLTFSRIPWVNLSSTFSATLLESGYITGNIYSLNFSKDLLKGKLSLDAGYRYVDYKLINNIKHLQQQLGEAGINWRIFKKLSFSVNYEGTFESSNVFNQFYFNLSKGF